MSRTKRINIVIPDALHKTLLELKHLTGKSLSSTVISLLYEGLFGSGGSRLSHKEEIIELLERLSNPNLPAGGSPVSEKPEHGKDKADKRPVQQLSQMLESAPDSAGLWLQRGQMHMELRSFYNAADDFSQAIRINPNSGLAYYKRSKAYEMLGYEQLAVQDRRQAKHLLSEK